MRRTWMSITLSGCVAASAACARTSTTSATESHSALPAVSEMQIKRNLLEGQRLPHALELQVLRQTQSSDASYLEYPTSLAASDDGDIYISDNNGDAIYHATSFQRLLRIYYTVFDFALDPAGNIFANPIFTDPKESDSLLVSLNKQGMRFGSFGKRINRTEHDGLEDRAYISAVDDLVIAAFRHQPRFQIYNSKTGDLLREIDVIHPAFPGLARLEADRKFVNPKPGVVRLPVYISGVDATRDRIYVLLCLPQPEIVEFSIQGQEIGRYRANSSVSALGYFGFRTRSVGALISLH